MGRAWHVVPSALLGTCFCYLIHLTASVKRYYEATAKRKADDQVPTKRKVDKETAAKKKADDEATAKKKADDEVVHFAKAQAALSKCCRYPSRRRSNRASWWPLGLALIFIVLLDRMAVEPLLQVGIATARQRRSEASYFHWKTQRLLEVLQGQARELPNIAAHGYLSRPPRRKKEALTLRHQRMQSRRILRAARSDIRSKLRRELSATRTPAPHSPLPLLWCRRFVFFALALMCIRLSGDVHPHPGMSNSNCCVVCNNKVHETGAICRVCRGALHHACRDGRTEKCPKCRTDSQPSEDKKAPTQQPNAPRFRTRVEPLPQDYIRAIRDDEDIRAIRKVMKAMLRQFRAAVRRVIGEYSLPDTSPGRKNEIMHQFLNFPKSFLKKTGGGSRQKLNGLEKQLRLSYKELVCTREAVAPADDTAPKEDPRLRMARTQVEEGYTARAARTLYREDIKCELTPEEKLKLLQELHPFEEDTGPIYITDLVHFSCRTYSRAMTT